jgi:prepilin-type N-terminal cleavage/methylation domain-containing protein
MKLMPIKSTQQKNQAGFSLIELVVAMTVTLVVMSVAVTMLARSLNVRSREMEHVDELADVQRALNIMSREISNAGFNLVSNGLVATDSTQTSIRIRANLNKFDFSPGVSADSRRLVQDPGEDITYFVNVAGNTNYLARWDRFESAGPGVDLRGTVLANRIDSVRFYYFDRKVTYTQDPPNCQITNPLNTSGLAQAEVAPADAKFVVLLVCIGTPAVGAPNSPGYQRPYQTLLVSDVALRNSRLNRY